MVSVEGEGVSLRSPRHTGTGVRSVAMDLVLAIDIGGTKFEVAVIDTEGVIHDRLRVGSVGATDGEDLFARLAELVAEIDRTDVTVCGVGSGGPMRRGGVEVSPLNIAVWRDFPLQPRLAELAGVPTFVDNDAKALALAEAWKGAAVGERNFIAMVVSTGVGGGIVLDGRLLDGDDGNAGHIGHVVVDPEGTVLPAHVRGVLEAEASGTAIAYRTGRPAVEANDDEIKRAGTMVGRAVGSVANLLDLPLAVVAGSVALGFGDPFFAAAQVEVDRVAALQHSLGTRIIPAALGDDGPLIGAAAVGLRGVGHDVGVR